MNHSETKKLVVTTGVPSANVFAERVSLVNEAGQQISTKTDAELNSRFVAQATSHTTELIAQPVFIMTPATASPNPYQIIFNSFENTGSGAGTYNHGMWFGFNAGRHAGGGTATANKVGMYMGFEDNYYDDGGDATYGPEWYVGYITPDGSTIPIGGLRPFYVRVKDGNANSASKSALITLDIGAGATGAFGVHKGVTNPALFGLSTSDGIMRIPFKIEMPSAGNALTLQSSGTSDPANLLFKTGSTTRWQLQSNNNNSLIFIDNVNSKQTMILYGQSTVDTSQVILNGVLALNNATSSSATAGGASALPATPQGYFQIKDSAGTTRKVPYYV